MREKAHAALGHNFGHSRSGTSFKMISTVEFPTTIWKHLNKKPSRSLRKRAERRTSRKVLGNTVAKTKW